MIELSEIPSGDNIATIFADDVGGDAWVGAECWITGWGYTGTNLYSYFDCVDSPNKSTTYFRNVVKSTRPV